MRYTATAQLSLSTMKGSTKLCRIYRLPSGRCSTDAEAWNRPCRRGGLRPAEVGRAFYSRRERQRGAPAGGQHSAATSCLTWRPTAAMDEERRRPQRAGKADPAAWRAGRRSRAGAAGVVRLSTTAAVVAAAVTTSTVWARGELPAAAAVEAAAGRQAAAESQACNPASTGPGGPINRPVGFVGEQGTDTVGCGGGRIELCAMWVC